MGKPYYKKSHRAWYCNQHGKTIRLGTTEAEALEVYRDHMAGNVCHQLSDLVARFLKHHAAVSEPSTVEFYRRPLEAFLKAANGIPIADLRPHHVITWLDRPMGSTYRHLQMRAVKACLAWGVSTGLITQSPLQHMKLPSPLSRGDEAYLTKPQWAKVQAHIDGALLDILLILRHTGCRPQEARRMEARHVQGKCVIFPKLESKGKIVGRVVNLDETALALCRRAVLKHPDGPLFRDDQDRPWTAKRLDKKCAALSRKLGIQFTPYSLRHTFATEAIIRGVDLQTIATLMGHKDLKMLSKVYQHVKCRSEHLRDSLARITA